MGIKRKPIIVLRSNTTQQIIIIKKIKCEEARRGDVTGDYKIIPKIYL